MTLLFIALIIALSSASELQFQDSFTVEINGLPENLTFSQFSASAPLDSVVINNNDYSVGPFWQIYQFELFQSYPIYQFSTIGQFGYQDRGLYQCGSLPCQTQSNDVCSSGPITVLDPPSDYPPIAIWCAVASPSPNPTYYSAYELDYLTTLVYTNYSSPLANTTSSTTIKPPLNGQNYSNNAVVNGYTLQGETPSTLYFITQNYTLIPQGDLSILQKPPTIIPPPNNAYQWVSGMQDNYPTNYMIYPGLNYPTLNNVNIGWDYYAVIGPGSGAYSANSGVSILSKDGIVQMASQTVFIDPCNQNFYTLVINNGQFSATGGTAEDTSFCIILQENGQSGSQLTLFSFQTGSYWLYPSSEFTGVLSSDIINSASIYFTVDATIEVDEEDLQISFSFNPSSSEIQIDVQVPAQCLITVSPTCSYNISFTESNLTSAVNVSECGPLSQQAEYNCDGTIGGSPFPSNFSALINNISAPALFPSSSSSETSSAPSGSTSNAVSANTGSAHDGSNSTGLLIIFVVVGIVVLLFIGFLFWRFYLRRKSINEEKTMSQEGSMIATTGNVGTQLSNRLTNNSEIV